MANSEHLAILKQGVEVWNEWRKRNPDVIADLSRANLAEVDLREFDLSYTNLRESNLIGSILSRADLRGADLRGAHLVPVSSSSELFDSLLGSTELKRAQLIKANLKDANLSKTKLIGADFRKANLGKANLRETDLSAADLREADLRKADLRGANLSGADLRGANLWGADLRGIDLKGILLWQNDLLGAIFGETNLQLADVWKRYLDGASYPDTDSLGDYMRSSQASVSNIDGDTKFFTAISDVCFTALYPKEGKVETWHTLLVYLHLRYAIEDVRKDAQRFRDHLPAPKEVTSSSSTPIARGTEITVVPFCDGVTFNPQRIVVKWIEDYHRLDFRFRADQSLSSDAAKGQINIYVGPILIATLKFAMLFNETDGQSTQQYEDSSSMYHQEDIFVSYSHKDTDIILACKKAYEALGFKVLIDIDTLRAGQVWNAELMKMIDNATIFQLFWSQNSCQSKYCRQEWEHALKRNIEGFIRPVYWERPMPAPPEELSRYHFEYMEF